MVSGTPKLLYKIFFCIFSVLFLLVFIRISVWNDAFPCFDLMVLPLALASAGVLAGLFLLLKNRKCRLWYVFLAAAVVFFASAQIIIGLKMRFVPLFDLGAVFNGGLSVAQTGSVGKYAEYFAMFGNNLGGLAHYTWLFYLCGLLGITDFYAAALVCSVLYIQGTVVLVFFIVKQKLGIPAALVSLVAFGLLPSFYAWGGAFYTDLLSMPYVALTYFLFLRCRTTKRGKLLWAISAGLCCGIGTAIKGTCAIVLIAIAIEALLSAEKGRRAASLLRIGAACAVVVLLLEAFSCLMYSTVVSRELHEKKGMPLSHWVAMSLHGNGAYDGQDYQLAKALPDISARRAENAVIIARRLKENGFTGNISLFALKLCRDFGNGTFSVSDFLDDSPFEYGYLQQTVLTQGNNYYWYSNVSQGVYLAVFGFMVLGAALNAVRGRSLAAGAFIAVFGLALFLLFWETSARYIQNFFPLMLICGLCGIYGVAENKNLPNIEINP